MSLTSLGLGVGLLVAGPASDVIGRTRLIHLSLTASAVVAAACALAPSWHALLALRLLAGWRWALASAALLGIGCAIVVRFLLPASRRFTAASAAPRALASMSLRAVSDRGLLALYGVGACSVGARGRRPGVPRLPPWAR